MRRSLGNKRRWRGLLIGLSLGLLGMASMGVVLAWVLRPQNEPLILPELKTLPTWTLTPSPAPTNTPLRTPTFTASPSPSPTLTFTPSITPSLSPTASATFTLTFTPSLTLTPSATFRPPEQTGTASPTPAPFPFGTDRLTVDNLPDDQCNRQVFAGQVLSLGGQHLKDFVVVVTGGTLPPEGQSVITGVFPVYGESGWAIRANDGLLTQTYQVQLFDKAGRALSPRLTHTFSGRCNAAFVFITFRQVRPY